jgi:hypothetical protein
MTYEPTANTKAVKSTDCAFLTFSGTPTAGNPLTPTLVGSSSGFTPTISTNDIQLPAGEYMLRFTAAITRSAADRNIIYQWREVGGALIGMAGATNREIAPGSQNASLDSADAHLILSASGSVQVETTSVDAGVTINTSDSHAVIWRVG